MDKRHYYRVLGIREGAGAAEIKKAYDKHMRRLALPDYADDPQYVARKKDQIRHAYSVLIGNAPAAAKAEREARFEKLKDAEDAGEDALNDLQRKFKKHVRHCEAGETETDDVSEGLAQLKEVLRETFAGGKDSGGDRQTKLIKKIVGIVIGLSLFSSMITACGAMTVNVLDGVVSRFETLIPEYAVNEPAHSAEESLERMDAIVENCHLYDFYGNLDLSKQSEFAEQVEWEPGDETMSEIWSEMTDLTNYMGIYSNADAVAYITGNEDFYWESDDYSNAQMVVLLMNPPVYEEIAGGINLYTREIILDYADYLRFLGAVARYQTKNII